MNCDICGKTDIDPHTSYPEVVAYAKPKSQKGQNVGSSLFHRRPTGNHICSGCATDLQHGVDPRHGIQQELEMSV